MAFDDTLGLYVVADGMGGHLAGEVASKLVVNTMFDYFKTIKENGDAEALIDPDDRLSIEANQLLSGIRLSNKVVHQASLRNSSFRGMGSTISAVYFTDETLIAANVGDSPIYLVRGGKIELLSVPHTLLAEQMAIDPQNAQELGNKFKHVLTRAMGTEESVKADIYEIQCFKEDILVISSDGLSDKASPEEILDIVCNQATDRACQILVDLANQRGGDDNVTAIVLKIKMVHRKLRGLKKWFAPLQKKIF